MTPEELAKLQRDYLIRAEKRFFVLIAAEFEALKREIQQALIESDRTDLTFVEEFLTFVESRIEIISNPFTRIVTNAQNKVINFTSRVLKAYFPSLESKIFSPDKEAIQKLIGRSASGESLQKLFLKMRPEIAERTKAVLIGGFAEGKPAAAIAKDIKDVSGIARYNALRIARTETNEAYRAASREFYEAAEIKKYVWKSVRDGRTCIICWSLHNKIFPTAKKIFSHPMCRCVLLPYSGERLEDSNADFLSLEKGAQKEILGPRRFELFESGNLRIDDFIRSQKSKEGDAEQYFIRNLSELQD
jgi:SPP1 gp7 family putative phage head morphogenesis protein